MLELINNHLRKYPKSQARDLIKLIYQSEFGGGHLISDSKISFERLKSESKQLEVHEIKHEDIGNDLVRVYFGNLTDLELLTLNQIFVYSASLQQGSIDAFINKLEYLKSLCSEKKIAFNYEEITNEIKDYEKLNYPPISHSTIYRDTYRPHYRVVHKWAYQYFDLLLQINKCLDKRDSLNIAIDGKCSSGKSQLASMLGSIYNANIFKMDDFFLQPFQRNEARLKEAGGNVDYERFKATVIDCLSNHNDVAYQKFNCSNMALEQEVTTIPYKNINIIEGTYSLHPTFDSFYDYKIALTINDSLQEARILKRNGPMMLDKFKNIWIPLENKYFDTFDIFNKVDYLYDCNTNQFSEN